MNIILEFEKPIVELEGKLKELKHLVNSGDSKARIESSKLEKKIDTTLKEIYKKLNNKNILISAHGNSIRALCKYLFKLDNYQISNLEIPTGNPLLVEFDENNEILKCEYLDKDRAKDLVVF